MRIKLNIFFILFLFLSYYTGYLIQSVQLFICVLLHEIGHMYAAKKNDIKVEEIELFPFGSVARMEDITKYGGLTEVVIAIAGPLVSGMLAIICYIFSHYDSFMLSCVKCNLFILGFNLIPVLPMDGGRIARNLLLMYYSYKKATKIMAYAGRILSILFVLYNIYLLSGGNKNLTYLIIAIFIYLGTIKEMKYCSYYYLLNTNNKKIRRSRNRKIKKRILEVSEATYIKNIVNQFSPGGWCVINVLDNSKRIKKVLSEAEIMEGFLKYGYDGRVEQIIKQ